jgi:hypothetical protein
MYRIDVVEAPKWSTAPFTKTKEGYLVGRACVTQIGVFPYLQADGSTIHELRCPEEVFKQESMDSLKLLPLTNEHPSFRVTSENVRQVQVGNVGSNPSGDNVYLTVDMIIQDEEAINDVMAGKRELSCGYSADLDPTPGVWGGISYDAIQKNVAYNHISIVPRARAGDAARIRLDAAGNAVINREENIKEEPVMAEATNVVVTIDASEVQNLIKAEKDRADGLQSNLDTLTTEKVKIEAERDTQKDRADKAELKVKELEASRLDEKAVEAAVARRVRILDAATKAGIEAKDMKEPDIQKAVVMKVFPKANFDGKDQVYLDARFDGAVEQLAEVDVADAATREVNAPVVDKKDEAPADSKKARQAYVDRLNKKDKV